MIRLRPAAALAVLLIPSLLRADERPPCAVIDAEIRAGWEREKVAPPGLADPGKRARLIDRLLDDPRYAAHQADVWDQVLFGRNPPGYDATSRRDGFKAWLAGKFANNEPYDRWARALLRAEEEDSTLFYVQ